ncbi:hypothetical protein [Sporisorium scitamineum]|uniref:Uncharacterized protein n=1 Tax=Sporisorium scitamineum TaxID=49012 RepID=A0A0F7S6H0_9BASI|nr:hypothetical protein [Sporisorium scitamineum]
MFSKNFLITFLAAALALPWANALTLPEDTVLWRPGEPPNSFLATVNRLVAEAVQGMQPTDYTAHGTPVYPSAPNGAVEAIFRSLQQDRRFQSRSAIIYGSDFNAWYQGYTPKPGLIPGLGSLLS